MTKCDLFVAVWLVLVFYTTRRVEGGIWHLIEVTRTSYGVNFSPEISSRENEFSSS